MLAHACLSCGLKNPEHARYCDQCGTALSRAGERARAWIVGSSPDCDLRVDDPTVSARHCQLIETNDGFRIEDLGSTNGTWVDGVRITSCTLGRQGRVTLGRTVPMPWPDTAPVRAPIVKGKVISVGREPDNDVVLDYPMISNHHARIVVNGIQILIEDLGSTNGTALGSPERRITRSPLEPADTVYFGSFPIPATRLLQGRLSLGKSAHKTLEFHRDSMVLGRDPATDVMLDYPMISWHHARLLKSAAGVTVEDLGSTNGTFVNGSRISGPVAIAAGDLIGLGSYVFRLSGLDRIEQRDYRGNVTIMAQGLVVDVPGRRLLEDVSLTIYPSELVALMGPSGAGKTTLMNTLNGYVRPSAGAVLFNGQDLYANYDQFRMHLGYVPQDDIMHRDLTVHEALYYSARLRLPQDMSDAEIEQRIAKVLNQLNLTDAADIPIGSPEKKGVSGGQRKRVNLAMELLTDPFVLFLDEPTSGLSSQDALTVVKLLRDLANEGKTILLTIHQPSREIFRLMDSVALVSKDAQTAQPGRLIYFGPAYPDAVRFFNHQVEDEAEPSPDLLLAAIEKPGSTAKWAAHYAASRIKRQYVDERAGASPISIPGPGAAPAQPVVRRDTGLLQWLTLLRRGFLIKVRDVWNTSILLAQAPIIAFLLVAVFRREVKPAVDDQNWLAASHASATVLFLMVISALWFGCSNSAREIVGEWAIYHRERMINLKVPSYVVAKLMLLGALCVVQCAMLLGIVSLGCNLRGHLLPMFALLLLTALVGVALGLVVSAVSWTSEVAVSLVPLVLLPMVILGGMMQPTYKMVEPLRWLTAAMPSRWSFEGVLLIETERFPGFTPKAPPAVAPVSTAASPPASTEAPVPPQDLAGSFFPSDARSSLAKVAAVSAFMFTLLTLAIGLILKRRDVH